LLKKGGLYLKICSRLTIQESTFDKFRQRIILLWELEASIML